MIPAITGHSNSPLTASVPISSLCLLRLGSTANEMVGTFSSSWFLLISQQKQNYQQKHNLLHSDFYDGNPKPRTVDFFSWRWKVEVITILSIILFIFLFNIFWLYCQMFSLSRCWDSLLLTKMIINCRILVLVWDWWLAEGFWQGRACLSSWGEGDISPSPPPVPKTKCQELDPNQSSSSYHLLYHLLKWQYLPQGFLQMSVVTAGGE